MHLCEDAKLRWRSRYVDKRSQSNIGNYASMWGCKAMVEISICRHLRRVLQNKHVGQFKERTPLALSQECWNPCSMKIVWIKRHRQNLRVCEAVCRLDVGHMWYVRER